MSKIDFYVLKTDSISESLVFICKLLRKAYHHKNQIFVHSYDQKLLQALNTKLWTFHDTSFIPHKLQNEGTFDSPIILGDAKNFDGHNDILLNLECEIPENYATFSRVIEIVTQDPNTKESLRKHYQFYQQAGNKIETQKL